MLVADSVRLMESDQTKIFNLGFKMVNESSYLDRIRAQGELLRLVEGIVAKVSRRKELLCPGCPDNCREVANGKGTD